MLVDAIIVIVVKLIVIYLRLVVMGVKHVTHVKIPALHVRSVMPPVMTALIVNYVFHRVMLLYEGEQCQ